jgi:hypothetical protein
MEENMGQTISPAEQSTPESVVVKKSHEEIHNASQQAGNLRQVLEDDKLRIGFFLGAGCPLGIYNKDGTTSLRLIPDINGLTGKVISELNGDAKLRNEWDALRKECAECLETQECKVCSDRKCSNGTSLTVEDVLTELRTLSTRRGRTKVLGMTKQDLAELDDKICDLIKAEMTKVLPDHQCSYTRFASWIGGTSRSFPIEIFTPNYDLLFEQAFEQQSLPHFDGFVGTRKPWFDLASIEHDVIPTRWTRLWKLHGSINWERSNEEENGRSVIRVVRVTGEATGKVMIYPSHLKYDQSRRMPYLAMLDRLRAFFRGDIAGRRRTDHKEQDAPRLVICGYSFVDDHFNEVLLDGLRGNLNAHCFALMYANLADHQRAVECAQGQPNLTVLAKDGAVVGTRIGKYRVGTSGGKEHAPWLYEEEGEEQSEKHTRSRLGDFHYFGLFLEQLCGGSRHHGQDPIQS